MNNQHVVFFIHISREYYMYTIYNYKFLLTFSNDKKISKLVCKMSLKDRNNARQDASDIFTRATSQLSCFRRKRHRICANLFGGKSGLPLRLFQPKAHSRERNVRNIRPNERWQRASVPFLTATVFSRRIRSAFNNSHAQTRPHPANATVGT